MDINNSTQGIHRIIYQAYHGVSLTSGQQVDHINGDKNNNSIFNLRLATNSQNNQNKRKARSDSKSGIKGVQLTSNGRFRAVFRGRSQGTFLSAEEARVAYERACLNFNQKEDGFYPVGTQSSAIANTNHQHSDDDNITIIDLTGDSSDTEILAYGSSP
jgi:hypothetical protein